jgi:hypothetical protein
VVEEMARRLSMVTRRELKQAVGERYRAAGRLERRQISGWYLLYPSATHKSNPDSTPRSHNGTLTAPTAPRGGLR